MVSDFTESYFEFKFRIVENISAPFSFCSRIVGLPDDEVFFAAVEEQRLMAWLTISYGTPNNLLVIFQRFFFVKLQS